MEKRELKCLRCGGEMYFCGGGFIDLRNPGLGILPVHEETEIWCCHDCGKQEFFDPNPAPKVKKVSNQTRCPHCHNMHEKGASPCPHCGFRMF